MAVHFNERTEKMASQAMRDHSEKFWDDLAKEKGASWSALTRFSVGMKNIMGAKLGDHDRDQAAHIMADYVGAVLREKFAGASESELFAKARELTGDGDAFEDAMLVEAVRIGEVPQVMLDAHRKEQAAFHASREIQFAARPH